MTLAPLTRTLAATCVALTLTTLLPAQTTQVIAHRGYWRTAGSAQNSLAALVRADAIGCYGSEFDVWLTADDSLVVNHDTRFKGVTPEEATARVCTAVTLDNGEQLPTLYQYLQLGRQLRTRLILEFKQKSLTEERQTQAVARIIDLVARLGLQDRMEYIAFSLHATKEFVRLAPAGTPVYYLNGDLTPAQLKELGCTGADYSQKVLRAHPDWIKQCHDLGLKVNVWTVDDAPAMRHFIHAGADFITTNEPELLQREIEAER